MNVTNLVNALSRQMLIDTGRAEIAAGRNTAAWEEIVQFVEEFR